MNAAELRAECWRLRQQGLTLARICRQMNLTRKHVKELLTEYEAMLSRREWSKLLLGPDAIERLSLCNQTYNALKRGGVSTISVLEKRLKKGPDLREIRRVGRGAYEEIKRAVESYRATETTDASL